MPPSSGIRDACGPVDQDHLDAGRFQFLFELQSHDGGMRRIRLLFAEHRRHFLLASFMKIGGSSLVTCSIGEYCLSNLKTLSRLAWNASQSSFAAGRSH